MKFLSLISLFLVALISSCASVNTSKSSDNEAYREDLAMHRPVYDIPEDTVGNSALSKADYSNIEPENDITVKLDRVLNDSDLLLSEVETVDGFTIQVYTGSSSDEARIIKGKLVSLLPDEHVELFYDEPSFKVKVGRFYSRMEAQKVYASLQDRFPNAIIIPDKIPIP